MLKLGIIGTNWITHQFVGAALGSKNYELTAIYSRRADSALAFGEPYGVTTVSTDLREFVSLPELDVIYIASPNSLHVAQAKLAIEHGKHVIVEKPAVSTSAELAELIALAKEKEVYYFEAARNIHEASFKKVTEILPQPADIIGANFSFMKYSSRYDLVLEGQEPNIFSPQFSGGALMDLGIYVVYAAVAWFGKPESVHYFARKVPTGVDGIGTIILRYANFDVNLMTGKIGNSFLPSEIYSLDETIVLNAVNSIESIKVFNRHEGAFKEVVAEPEDLPMISEARDFAAVITQPDNPSWQAQYEEWLVIAQNVHAIMEELRHQAGIEFPADK